eukprot:447925_1
MIPVGRNLLRIITRMHANIIVGSARLPLPTAFGTHTLSACDLLGWCARLEERVSDYRGAFVTSKIRERILMVARDCFVSLCPRPWAGQVFLRKLAIVFKLDHGIADHIHNEYMNLNQQTDSADFLGGYRPADLRLAAVPLLNEISRLMGTAAKDGGGAARNEAFLVKLKQMFSKKKWKNIVKLFQAAIRHFHSSVDEPEPAELDYSKSRSRSTQMESVSRSRPASLKRRVVAAAVRTQGREFEANVEKFGEQVAQSQNSFVFWFHEDALVRALREGHWLLLGEANLAGSDALQRLGAVLDSPSGSVVLQERGDAKALPRHPDFHQFASMNPPTDLGKRTSRLQVAHDSPSFTSTISPTRPTSGR